VGILRGRERLEAIWEWEGMPLVCGCNSSRYGRGASMCGGICDSGCSFDLEAFCGVNVTEERFTCDGV